MIPTIEASVLFMLLAINAAPILTARLFAQRAMLPVDLGKFFGDGRPLFGESKTWRGVMAAVLTSVLLSLLFGWGYFFGLAFGSLVMAGDLLSSFVKRRRGLLPSDQSLGWDQLPESFLPSLYAVFVLDLSWWWAAVIPLVFMLVELGLSGPLYRMKIRKRPY